MEIGLIISKLEQVSQEQNHNQNFVVCYKAVVKLIVKRWKS